MSPQDALSYSSSTVLGQQIAAMQQLYASMVASQAPQPLVDKTMGILGNLITLNEKLIAYEKDVSDFQTRCTALARGRGLGGVPQGGTGGVPAYVIGLGAGLGGGILGFVAAKALSPKKSEEDEEETDA